MVESKSNNKVVLISIISGLLGVFVGLVILGWWLFPVQWTGGTLEIVDAQIQEDWLRMAIDSYSINQDQELAQSRYEALGSQKEVVLATIWDNPGQQSPVSIKEYSVAVGVDDVAALTPAPMKPAKAPRLIYFLDEQSLARCWRHCWWCFACSGSAYWL